MFDDLHDPNPPTPGTDTLAAVATRARRIRRRRSASVGAGVLGVGVIVLATVAVIGPRDATIVPANPDRELFVDPSMIYLDLAESAELPICGGDPVPPPWLRDGTLPGESVADEITIVGQAYRTVRWGSGDSAVHQFVEPDAVLWPERALPGSASYANTPVPFASVPGGRPGSEHMRIIDEAGDCRRDYLVDGGVFGVGLFLETWTLQLALARAGVSAVDRSEIGICASIAGVDTACIADQMIDRNMETGAAAMAYEVLNDTAFGSVTIEDFQTVGLVHIVVGADDVVSPLSHHAVEVSIPGTRLKSVVDLTLAAPEHCVVVTSPSGERRTVSAMAPVVDVGTVESAATDCSAVADDLLDETPATTIVSPPAATAGRVDVDPACLASLAPVWLPDGSAADAAVEDAVVGMPDGSEVEAISWGSRQAGAALLQLTTLDSAHTFDVSPPQFAYEVDADAMTDDRSLITIGRRSDGCTAQYVFEGTVEQALAFASSWTDQMVVGESEIALVEDPEDVYCAAVDGVTRETDCLGAQPVGEPEGASSQGFVIGADGFGSALRGPVGVVFLVISADAGVDPRSRLAREEMIGDTGSKAFFDVVPADDVRCFEIADGSTTFVIRAPVAGEGDCPIDP